MSMPTTRRRLPTGLGRADCVDEPGRWEGEPIAATRTDLLRGTERLSVGEDPAGRSGLLPVVSAVHGPAASLALGAVNDLELLEAPAPADRDAGGRRLGEMHPH